MQVELQHLVKNGAPASRALGHGWCVGSEDGGQRKKVNENVTKGLKKRGGTTNRAYDKEGWQEVVGSGGCERNYWVGYTQGLRNDER